VFTKGGSSVKIIRIVQEIEGFYTMAKKGDKRKLIGLVSEESGERIYYTTKNTMNTPDKLSLRKYSPKLRKHVVFTETKKNLGRNEVKPKK
jgi:large subunit ribosomal protein L33